jgi:hypothetical protein
MKRNIAQSCFCLLGMAGMVMTLNASVIYTDLTPTRSWSLPSLNGEMGNEVTAAGTDRFVTILAIEIYSQNGLFPNGTPGYADFHAQLYANDGPLGQPGSLLWQSAVVHVNYPGGLSLLTFDVPQVLVPNVFTWTLQYSNTSLVPPALPGAAAPTTGGSDACWARGSSSPWGQVPAAGNLMAQIQAVPEPRTSIILSAGVLTLCLLRRLQRQFSES